MTFSGDTAVRPRSDNVWDADIAPDWDIFGNANGGYMLAIATRAASLAVDGRRPVSTTGQFTRPGHEGPISITTEVTRHGRRFSVVRATVNQNEQVILEVLSSFAESEDVEPGILLSDATPPDLPPPDECLRATPAPDAPLPPPSVGKVDLRVPPYMAGVFAGQPTGKAIVEGWFRLLDDEPVDGFALIAASDAFPPTTFNAGLPMGWTPTLDLNVHVRVPQPNGWIRCQFISRFISSGFIEEDGLFWDEQDRLVGQSRQLAMVSR